ncbi:MAG: hypothetical protein ACM3S5_09075 [Rhodospirillales bacterium]
MPGILPVISALYVGVGLLTALAIPCNDPQPPLPFLNQDGSKPQGLEDKNTFLDPKTGDIIAIYRSTSGEPGAAGGEVRVRIQLSRHTCPSILSTIAYDEQFRTFQYSYVLRNCASARQIAWKWYFDHMDESNTEAVQVPPGWRHEFPVHAVGGVPVSEQAKAIALAFRAMRFYSVNTAGAVEPELGVSPGGVTAGFEVRSSKRPGLISVLVQGDAAIPAYPDEPPENVSSEVDAVLRSPYNYQPAFTFGPKYEATADRATIARGLLADLSVLTGAGQVDPKGRFAAYATALLQRSLKEAVPVADLARLRQEGKADMEHEFAAAVSCALSPSRDCAR